MIDAFATVVEEGLRGEPASGRLDELDDELAGPRECAADAGGRFRTAINGRRLGLERAPPFQAEGASESRHRLIEIPYGDADVIRDSEPK